MYLGWLVSQGHEDQPVQLDQLGQLVRLGQQVQPGQWEELDRLDCQVAVHVNVPKHKHYYNSTSQVGYYQF